MAVLPRYFIRDDLEVGRLRELMPTVRLREDVVTEQTRREAFQAIAPETEAGLYLVPKVIE